jgi:hypothetical protein
VIKIFLGIIIGIAISSSAGVYAASYIQAVLSDAKLQLNAKYVPIDNEYRMLNYEGHMYVPLRFIAEKLGAGVGSASYSFVIQVRP